MTVFRDCRSIRRMGFDMATE